MIYSETLKPHSKIVFRKPSASSTLIEQKAWSDNKLAQLMQEKYIIS